jgi:hypothetical protein
MADITYIVNQDNPDNISGVEKFSQADSQLVNQFGINTLFDRNKNYVELHIFNLADEILQSDYDYTNYLELGNAQSAGKEGASVLTIDAVSDIKKYGYLNGDVKLLYHFVNNLFSAGRANTQFFIQDISADRTELKLQTFDLSDEEILKYVKDIQDKFNNQPYFNEFRLNFQNNDLLIGLNVDVLVEGGNNIVTVKLYEPLPGSYGLKSTLSITELVSDSVVFEVDSITEPEVIPVDYIRPANFNLDVIDNDVIPTQYFNYEELFSYPINNTNSQVYSLLNEKGAELSIDHTDYNNFIHFSSAYERLANFKYKLQLIEGYSSSLAQIKNSVSQSVGITGSVSYYENLTQGILNNLDHYERFLYYKSSSYAWPKSNNTTPYINRPTANAIAQSWYVNQLAIANKYDLSNLNAVVNTIPSFLRDDPNNENYLTFVHMIGQHFDNLWIYTKGVSDKYNADNRLDSGISKDLVGEVLKNFGVKLYTSNKSIEDLFGSFIGQAYQSGSEVISTYVTGSITGSNTPIGPSSVDNYQREVYKRIYHNLPLLLKSKGTERGLRALINCFGIPSDILDIKIYGGRNRNERPFYGDYRYYTSSLDKVRLDNTGSIVTGSTLSQYTSIIKRDDKYTDDLHPIEIGFSPTDNVDNYIINRQTCVSYRLVNGPLQSFYSYTDCTGSFVGPVSIAGNRAAVINALQESIVVNGSLNSITPLNSTSSFNIDDYIGDPRNLYLDDYYTFTPTGSITGSLDFLTHQVMSGSTAYDVQDFVRLIKFYDNTIFKMVKDFIPARAVADTGIIIKPHVLSRSKAKSVILSGSRPFYTGSIDTAFISAGDTNNFKDSYNATEGVQDSADTRYLDNIQTPTGIQIRDSHNHLEVNYNGEVSASNITVSTRDLNKANPYKEPSYSAHPYPVSFISESNEICLLDTSIYTPSLITNPSQSYSADAFFTFINPNFEYSASINGGSTWVSPITFPTYFPITGLPFTAGVTQSITIRALNKNVVAGTCVKNNTISYAPCTLLQSTIGLAISGVTKQTQFQQGIDITTWFTANPAQILQYTASWTDPVSGPQVVPLPLGNIPQNFSAQSFKFDQPVDTVVTIKVVDQALRSACQIEKSVTITECNLKRKNYSTQNSVITGYNESQGGFTFRYSYSRWLPNPSATTATLLPNLYFMEVINSLVEEAGIRTWQSHLGGGYSSPDPNYPQDPNRFLPRFYGIQSYFRNVVNDTGFTGANVDINPALRYNIYVMTNANGQGNPITGSYENTEGYKLSPIALGIDPRDSIANWPVVNSGFECNFVPIYYGNIAGNGLYNMPSDPNFAETVPNLLPITFKPIVLQTQLRNTYSFPEGGSYPTFTDVPQNSLIRAYVIECYNVFNPLCRHQVVVYGERANGIIGLNAAEGSGTYPQFRFKNILAGWNYNAAGVGSPVVQPTPGYPAVPTGGFGPWITTKVRTFSSTPLPVYVSVASGISPNTPPD